MSAPKTFFQMLEASRKQDTVEFKAKDVIIFCDPNNTSFTIERIESLMGSVIKFEKRLAFYLLDDSAQQALAKRAYPISFELLFLLSNNDLFELAGERIPFTHMDELIEKKSMDKAPFDFTAITEKVSQLDTPVNRIRLQIIAEMSMAIEIELLTEDEYVQMQADFVERYVLKNIKDGKRSDKLNWRIVLDERIEECGGYAPMPCPMAVAGHPICETAEQAQAFIDIMGVKQLDALFFPDVEKRPVRLDLKGIVASLEDSFLPIPAGNLNQEDTITPQATNNEITAEEEAIVDQIIGLDPAKAEDDSFGWIFHAEQVDQQQLTNREIRRLIDERITKLDSFVLEDYTPAEIAALRADELYTFLAAYGTAGENTYHIFCDKDLKANVEAGKYEPFGTYEAHWLPSNFVSLGTSFSSQEAAEKFIDIMGSEQLDYVYFDRLNERPAPMIATEKEPVTPPSDYRLNSMLQLSSGVSYKIVFIDDKYVSYESEVGNRYRKSREELEHRLASGFWTIIKY